MKGATMKKIAITSLFLFLCLTLSAAGSSLTSIGIGGASISYGEEFDEIVDSAEAYGIDRTTLFIDLLLGYSPVQNSYVTVGVNGVGDRFMSSYSSESMQLNSYLYYVGYRTYPNTTGMYWEIDGGGAKMMIVQNEDFGDAVASDWGTGICLKAGYDFSKDNDGFSLSVGVAANASLIEDETITSGAVYASLNWK